jgi:hypothetical protein
VDGTACDIALGQATTRWHNAGLDFDPATMRLMPQSTLAVSFPHTGGGTLCDPSTQGGYIGPDNQMIRVQIVSPTQILWGFDDASFLYRVTVGQDRQTIALQSTPVDAFHQPRKSQAVEVLRATARLSNGEYVAYTAELDNPPAPPYSFATTLSSAYNPNDRTVVLASQLPNVYSNQSQTPRVFLRVWEELLTFTPGTPLALGNTGVSITLQTTHVFHDGDFWTFAVRPDFPTLVYPERYATPQPPEGPRQWICPLAVINWFAERPTATDCRNPFNPLITPINVQDEGTTVAVTSTINFIGDGVTAVFDPVNKRANITIPGAVGGGNGCCCQPRERRPTRLLFPFVTNQAGFDTGIAISNTTGIPSLGPPQPSPPGVPGNCRMHFCGQAGTTAPARFDFILRPCEQFVFLLSSGGQPPSGGPRFQGAGGFQGMIIVECDFAGAYGFAQISDVGAQKLASGYLAIVLQREPECRAFRDGFVPFQTASVSEPDFTGDRIVVGTMTGENFTIVQQLTGTGPGPFGEIFCGKVQMAPGLSTVAYVPTTAFATGAGIGLELQGNFSAFGGPVIDPVSSLPFPGNIIPANRLPPNTGTGTGVFAWRIRCLETPGATTGGQTRILSFASKPEFSSAAGSVVTLTWATENATSVIITGTSAPAGPLPLSGSANVTPVSNADYTLTAYGAGSPVSVVLHVFVR